VAGQDAVAEAGGLGLDPGLDAVGKGLDLRGGPRAVRLPPASPRTRWGTWA
jgi:hypothetical protein